MFIGIDELNQRKSERRKLFISHFRYDLRVESQDLQGLLRVQFGRDLRLGFAFETIQGMNLHDQRSQISEKDVVGSRWHDLC